MKQYIGVKMINAEPMTRLEYNEFRGWELPEDEKGDDAGFLVEYIDGGKPNTEAYVGYVSWSPNEVFENAYREISGLSFGLAIEAMKKGFKVARAGWNGKGMWLILIPGSEDITFHSGTPYAVALNGDTESAIDGTINPHIDMFTASGEMQPGWLASQTDMLADDWLIIG